MSGKYRGSSRLSALLDKLFLDKRRTIGIPIAITAALYALALIFGRPEGGGMEAVKPLIISVLAFPGVLLVMGFQLFNPFATAKSMDLAEAFFAGVILIMGSAWMVLYGIGNLFTKDAFMTAGMAAEMTAVWCALCVIHNKRI